MVYSSSSVISLQERGDSLFYLKRHAGRLVLGLGAMILFTLWDYQKFVRYGVLLCLFFFCLLPLVYVPGLGVEVNGSRRWIQIAGVMIQPSEYFKVAYIIFLAKILSTLDQVKDKFKKVILPQLVFLSAVFILIQKEPNLSTALLVLGIGLCMIFLVYQNHFLLLGIAVGGLGGILYLIFETPYRLKRVTAFLNPFENEQESGYQIIQSFVSLGSGGWTGLGLGESRQKFFYLPEEHTDFIFAVLGEEFGFLGCLIVIIAFMLFVWRGVVIASQIGEPLGKLLAFGVVCYIVFQILINLLVVAGLIPPTGVPLPFVSYGGSSLVANLIGVGILLNISRYCHFSK